MQGNHNGKSASPAYSNPPTEVHLPPNENSQPAQRTSQLPPIDINNTAYDYSQRTEMNQEMNQETNQK